LTQSDVAASAQVTRQSLAAIERGKPTAEVGLCLRILDALGLDVEIVTHSESDDPIDEATDQLNRALERMRDR
jgi:DNA-binding XRE family transcriptional regulator